jgi:hypothetical protein
MLFTGVIAVIEQRARLSASHWRSRIGFTFLTWIVAVVGLTAASVEGIYLMEMLRTRSIEAALDGVRTNLAHLLPGSSANQRLGVLWFWRIIVFPSSAAAGFGLTTLRRLVGPTSGAEPNATADQAVMFWVLTLANPLILLTAVRIALEPSAEGAQAIAICVGVSAVFALCSRFVVSELTRYADQIEARLFGPRD